MYSRGREGKPQAVAEGASNSPVRDGDDDGDGNDHMQATLVGTVDGK